MTTPAEVKFRLEQKLHQLASVVGVVPQIIGLHSVVVEGDTVSVGYDIAPPPPDGEILFFEFERPALVSREDLREFSAWLAWDGGGTMH